MVHADSTAKTIQILELKFITPSSLRFYDYFLNNIRLPAQTSKAENANLIIFLFM